MKKDVWIVAEFFIYQTAVFISLAWSSIPIGK
jgi:hypothetical protein